MIDCKYLQKEPKDISCQSGEVSITSRNVCFQKRSAEHLKTHIYNKLFEKGLEGSFVTDECPIAGKTEWNNCPFYFPNVPYPKTLQEAVNLLFSILSDETKEKLKKSPKENLSFFGLGTYIRNEFGLWKGNKELLDSCGVADPDDASSVIINALWDKLQTEEDIRKLKAERDKKLKPSEAKRQELKKQFESNLNKLSEQDPSIKAIRWVVGKANLDGLTPGQKKLAIRLKNTIEQWKETRKKQGIKDEELASWLLLLIPSEEKEKIKNFSDENLLKMSDFDNISLWFDDLKITFTLIRSLELEKYNQEIFGWEHACFTILKSVRDILNEIS